MIYTPENLTDAMSNRMSPELNKEVAERIAEILASMPLSFYATEDEIEALKRRMEEDA